RIYYHQIARFNYTTYDVRRAQDVINPRTPHCNIMILNNINNEASHYRYAKVLGVHHANIVFAGSGSDTHRMDFLFVRWYECIELGSWEMQTLDRVRFKPLDCDDAFGFISPDDILRSIHIIPCFSRGMRHEDGVGISLLAGDCNDWHEYYVNR
ncbi:hypothetical protein BJ138DRAFT_1019753, partial [Hygrophoropsis aurantiaca]